MSPAVFEEAVELTASLLYASAVAGQHCRLITATGTDTTVDSGLRVARVLLDVLCLVSQDAADDAPLLPGPLAAARRPGGILVMITGPEIDLGPEVSRSRPDTVIRLGAQQPSGGAGLITAPDAAGATARWNALRAGPA
jgi:hypothetical protein